MTSGPPPFEQHGPPTRSEFPDGAPPAPAAAPPFGPQPKPPADADGLAPWPAWAPFAAMLLTVVIAVLGVSIIAFAATLAGVEVSSGDPPPGVTIGGTFVQDLALIFSALLLARVTAGTPEPWQFGLRRTPLRRAAGQLALAWLAFIVFSWIWASALGITENDDLPQELGADDSTTALVAVAVLVCVMAPIAEELFFRGFCFTALRRWIGVIPGALAAGIIFGLIHAGSADAVFLAPLAFLGVALCVLYYRTGSLLPCMVLHAFNNSLALGVTQSWPFVAVIALMGASATVVLAIVLPFTRAGRPQPAALMGG